MDASQCKDEMKKTSCLIVLSQSQTQKKSQVELNWKDACQFHHNSID
jgi:hypothetical protein